MRSTPNSSFTRRWAAWATRCAGLLRPGGSLAGFFFVDEAAAEPRRGPPFAVTSAELRRLLDPAFDLAVDRRDHVDRRTLAVGDRDRPPSALQRNRRRFSSDVESGGEKRRSHSYPEP